MSHNIRYDIEPEKVNRDKVQSYWDEVAAREDAVEGCSGLPGNIRWTDYTCKNEEEAKRFIENHDKGWYDQLAVKFIDTSNVKKTSSTAERLKKQILDYQQKYVDYNNMHSLTNQKAEFISCPQCSSKLSRIHLKGNGCPVCGKKDIRSATVLKQLNSFTDKIDKWEKEYAAENKRLAEKAAKQGKVMWLIKVEYHT